MTPTDPVPTHCPRCASTQIKAVLETNYGWYWRCEACGEIWHQDTRPRSKDFEQRTTDLLDAVREYFAFDLDFIGVERRSRRTA